MYAEGCGPASLAPVAFSNGDRVAYEAHGGTVTIGVLRRNDAVEVLAGPRPGGQAILPGGVHRVVALSRGCWSVLREAPPQPEGQGSSSLATVGSARLDRTGRVEACGAAEIAAFVSHAGGRLAWSNRGPGMLLVTDGRTTIIHSTGSSGVVSLHGGNHALLVATAACWKLRLSG
jgi:hypothetical protein